MVFCTLMSTLTYIFYQMILLNKLFRNHVICCTLYCKKKLVYLKKKLTTLVLYSHACLWIILFFSQTKACPAQEIKGKETNLVTFLLRIAICFHYQWSQDSFKNSLLNEGLDGVNHQPLGVKVTDLNRQSRKKVNRKHFSLLQSVIMCHFGLTAAVK